MLVSKDGDQQIVVITELAETDLMDGDVTVAVEQSTVNYKDGLAISGKAPIIRKFPSSLASICPAGCCAPRILASSLGDVLKGHNALRPSTATPSARFSR